MILTGIYECHILGFYATLKNKILVFMFQFHPLACILDTVFDIYILYNDIKSAAHSKLISPPPSLLISFKSNTRFGDELFFNSRCFFAPDAFMNCLNKDM